MVTRKFVVRFLLNFLTEVDIWVRSNQIFYLIRNPVFMVMHEHQLI